MASSPKSPDAPLLTNLLVSAGTALVGILETRLAPAEDEANRLRQEKAAEADGSAIAPWQTLAEQYSILEDELKIRIFAIAESEANFSAEIAAKRRRSGNILPGCLPMANAALAADERKSRTMKRPLRFGGDDGPIEEGGGARPVAGRRLQRSFALSRL